MPVSDRHDDLSEDAIVAHDRQRAMPDDALQALITNLQSRIGEGPCLDAGAGTGAVAIPLANVGTSVVGLDLSWAMLRELRARLPDAGRVPLVRGDVTNLPFADGRFGAVHCAHTLHLIADWRKALVELSRVTASGGLLLFGLGGGLFPVPMLQDVQLEFQQALAITLGDTPSNVPGPASEEEFTEAMTSLGATPLPGIKLRYDQTTSIDIELYRLEHNVFGRSHTIDEDAIHAAAKHTRLWAINRFGSLNSPVHRQRTLTYHLYQKPSGR